MSGSSSVEQIFLVDFDKTIINESLAHLLEKKFLGNEPTPQEQIDFVGHLFTEEAITFIEEHKIRELILACIQNNIRVIVCTFNPFVHAIAAVLTHLSPQMQGIQIVSKPKGSIKNGKNKHIEGILNEALINESCKISRLVLLDDDQSVLDAAVRLMATDNYNDIHYRGFLAAPDDFAPTPELRSRYLDFVYHEFSLPVPEQFILPCFSVISEDRHTTPVRQTSLAVGSNKRGRLLVVDDSDLGTDADSRSSSRSGSYSGSSHSLQFT